MCGLEAYKMPEKQPSRPIPGSEQIDNIDIVVDTLHARQLPKEPNIFARTIELRFSNGFAWDFCEFIEGQAREVGGAYIH